MDITLLMQVRRLVNVNYDSFNFTLLMSRLCWEAHALSVETDDSKVLNLAREDIVWDSVRELIEDVPG